MIEYVFIVLAFDAGGWIVALAWSAVIHYDEYKSMCVRWLRGR